MFEWRTSSRALKLFQGWKLRAFIDSHLLTSQASRRMRWKESIQTFQSQLTFHESKILVVVWYWLYFNFWLFDTTWKSVRQSRVQKRTFRVRSKAQLFQQPSRTTKRHQLEVLLELVLFHSSEHGKSFDSMTSPNNPSSTFYDDGVVD